MGVLNGRAGEIELQAFRPQTDRANQVAPRPDGVIERSGPSTRATEKPPFAVCCKTGKQWSVACASAETWRLSGRRAARRAALCLIRQDLPESRRARSVAALVTSRAAMKCGMRFPAQRKSGSGSATGLGAAVRRRGLPDRGRRAGLSGALAPDLPASGWPVARLGRGGAPSPMASPSRAAPMPRRAAPMVGRSGAWRPMLRPSSRRT